MVQMVCNCLNVGIHCKENQFNSTLKQQNDYFFDVELESEDQFLKNCHPMTLALAGVTMEHDYLCWTRIVGQWAINHCLICETDTHATHIIGDNQRRILVNVNLESNVSRIESLRKSRDYSPVFRILLPEKPDNQLKHSKSQTSSAVEIRKRSLQQRVQRFLNEEQKLMEERIRTFTEQEHSRFAEMQLKIGRNEESLYEILDQIGDKLSLKSDIDKSFGSLTQQTIFENAESNLDNNSYLDLVIKPTKQQQNLSNQKLIENKLQKKSQSFEGRYRSQSVDYESFGGVFDIDVDEGNAFDSISYSDEEDIDEVAFRNGGNDLNLNNSRSAAQESDRNNAQINAQNSGLIAYSLPIQVPRWKTFNNPQEGRDDDKVPMVPNGETIAESIQKLAKSVRNETDIFGDRPRRRLNTGDLIKSRPI